jgi:hypothetical protein
MNLWFGVSSHLVHLFLLLVCGGGGGDNRHLPCIALFCIGL